MEMDLKLLQYAVILAKHRHFGRAAAALRISQPTLSRNIATLEKQLGLRVFERSHRDVVATPAGDDVLKMANELVARAEAISNRLELVRDGRGGRLRVAAGAYVHDIAVQPAAIELINAHPSIRLELLEREWTAVGAMLMTDRIDFAVFDIASLSGMPTLRVESLGTLQGVYFCRASHPLLKKKSLQPADIRNYPFVLPGLSHLHAGLIDNLDAGLTLDPITGDVLPSIAVSSFRVSREVVAGTDAISIGHVSQVKEGLAAGRFAILDLPWRNKLPAAEMGIAYKRERTLPPSARTFISLIRKHMRAIERS
jgi:DNA-binding transcriptional LysR family regulator